MAPLMSMLPKGYRQNSKGIIPTGSGNGLARELCISDGSQSGYRNITKAPSKEIDTCEANGEPFFVTCGIGFDSGVSDRVAKRKPWGSYLCKGNTFSIP